MVPTVVYVTAKFHAVRKTVCKFQLCAVQAALIKKA